ncbi:beta-glucuronidase [Aestuariibaculum sp. M13]|uniref:beta-glucuronidase n=1 Tax=Aestuariibaculum sp. M13 TaxID=2967132 RepID=UPI002159C56D|nr:beta-glucuronidase [Aestuariibaculum sp. M13]MCR8667868.1 beta-glucuronidase [Aestuariibaculum sp. M13]
MKYSILLLFLAFSSMLNSQNDNLSDPKDIALSPIQNTKRNVLDLSGIWKFKKDSLNIGVKEQWYNGLSKTRSIAVPGSWNEQFDDMRDYLDWVWYETETYVPSNWKDQKVFLRINDATYTANIWINGISVGYHEGCHVPFAFDISGYINWDKKNKIIIQVENQLSPERVPTGNVKGGSFETLPASNYDFFPYSGLNRSVELFSVPKSFIRDITVKTDYNENVGVIDVNVEKIGSYKTGNVYVYGGEKVIESSIKFIENQGVVKVEVPNVRLWGPKDPFLYTVKVTLGDKRNPVDIYELKAGVRKVSVNEKSILLNDEPVFLKGFGRHEDFPVLGRSSSNSLIVKDFELMKWTGANSFRTTHYPYDEENYNLADREGFLVIGETPGVGLYFLGDPESMEKRQRAMERYITEMIYRDKNHPSIIMWCVANEPNDKAQLGQMGYTENNDKKMAYEEFEKLFKQVRSLDATRLVMYVGVMFGPVDWFNLTDVIAINRYWGWYSSPGDIKTGANAISKELDRLHRKFKKPCMITEFGADAQAGLHAVNPEMFTEEYQKEFIKAYLDVADEKDFVTGMHVWNLADFKTSQGLIRFGGYNLKGVFTRDRRPKLAAWFLRNRWKEL